MFAAINALSTNWPREARRSREAGNKNEKRDYWKKEGGKKVINRNNYQGKSGSDDQTKQKYAWKCKWKKTRNIINVRGKIENNGKF